MDQYDHLKRSEGIAILQCFFYFFNDGFKMRYNHVYTKQKGLLTMKRTKHDLKMDEAKLQISTAVRKIAKELDLSAAQVASILSQKSTEYLHYVVNEEYYLSDKEKEPTKKE